MKIPLFAKLSLVILVVGTGAVLSSSWKEMERSKRIEAEVDSLRQEADRIRGENRTVEEKIAFFSTDSFEERAAKEKLGMKKRMSRRSCWTREQWRVRNRRLGKRPVRSVRKFPRTCRIIGNGGYISG